jgi:hypothetical protein
LHDVSWPRRSSPRPPARPLRRRRERPRRARSATTSTTTRSRTSCSDATFPEFGLFGTPPTSPAAAFDAAELTSYSGTTSDLRNAITDVVVDDYCEFNVQVRQTTTAPDAAAARRNVVAIGTDSAGPLFGLAEDVDTGDSDHVDFSRVWAGSYQSWAGGPGGALNGASSTLARWARAIGGTAAHEAGHNYGLSHESSADLRAGEDALGRHVMPAGADVSDEQRAGFRRHFSDRSFSLLASNVGLSIQTMHNWDFVNPNAQDAHRLRMEFLSPNPSAILSQAYTGPLSPWGTPSIAGPLGTQVFKGQALNRYRLEWSTGQAWSGGAPGVVPGGATFHVGATLSSVDFNMPDAVIVNRVELLGAAGNPLALQPRLPGYDAGTLDARTGAFDMRFFNVASPESMRLRNVIVRELPRVLSIDAMMRDANGLFDLAGEPFSPWANGIRTVLERGPEIRMGDGQSIELSRLSRGRHILEQVKQGCDTQDNLTGTPDTGGCAAGVNVDLFPATTLYLTADVVTSDMRHWDAAQQRYVVGDVTTRVYFQVAGLHPDLNRNDVDDAIDIFTGSSADTDQNGVPDDVQPGEVAGTVPATLALTLSGPASFGTFTPGVTREYSASTTANVISTAGEATLTVADPSAAATGHLVNGGFRLAQPLRVAAGGGFANVGSSASPTALTSWASPVSNQNVEIRFLQAISGTEPLRTGTYGKTLTFSLATSSP